MSARAQFFEAHYRSLEDDLLFQFRFRCDAGSSAWRFGVKYGDLAITHTPFVYHDPGLLLYAPSRAELLDEAARWAEMVHSFYFRRPSRGPTGVLQLEAKDAGN